MSGGGNNQGFSTLLFTLIVLTAITLLSLISISTISTHQSLITSNHQEQTAFNAAEAGASYAIPYLDANYDTIDDGDTITVTLSDGSSAVVEFEFIGNKDLIRINAIGTSRDGLITKGIQQVVQYHAGGSIPFPVAAMTRGKLEMRDNAQIMSINGETVNAQTGLTNSSLHDNAKTLLDFGVSSTPGNIISDIQQGVDYLLTTDNVEIETDLMGQDIAAFQIATPEVDLGINAGTPQGTYIYDYNDSHFSPYAGASSYSLTQVDGEAQIKYDTVLGSESNPIVLEVNLAGQYVLPSGTVKNAEFHFRQNVIVYGDVIINGDAHFTDNVHITGNVIVKGHIHLVDNVIIDGAVISEGEVRLHNNSRVNGVVYSREHVSLYQNAIINGAAFAGDDHLKMYHNSQIIFDPALARVNSGASNGEAGYSIIAGSWSDMSSN